MADSPKGNCNESTLINENTDTLSIPPTQKSRIADSNDSILCLFSLCEEYLECQNQMNELLRNGYFQLAMARKCSCGITSLSDCRQEISASITASLSITSESVDLLCNNKIDNKIDDEPNLDDLSKLSLNNLTNQHIPNITDASMQTFNMNRDKSNDSAYFFSGMPPRALRKAQTNFTEVIRCAITLANIKNKLTILINQQSTE